MALPMTPQEPHIDPELIKNGDTRNVLDQYRNWTVGAIKADLQSKAFPLHMAIENYQHDYNIGTIVRSANAFNVAGVHIIGKRHWNRRGAMATDKYLELYHHPTLENFQEWAQKNQQVLIGVDNIPGSTPLGRAKMPFGAVLIFGQEGPGLSPDMQALCTQIIAIEQYGSTRSVNVGVAAGIVLYQWIQQNILN
jgi:tRNA G18 (ribose-2'-O)-methylase SpoU